MSEIPVPIPSGSVPAGASVWSTADAARWTRARAAPWARPVWSVWALLITVVWANAATPDQPCSDAVPCGADWLGMAETGLAVGLVYWLVRLPELTLVAAPALAAVVAWLELPDAGPMTVVANLSVLVALGFGWAAARERIAARSRQRGSAERAAGVRHALPDPVAPLRRGTLPIGAGLLLLGVAVFCVAQGLAGVHSYQHRAERAVRVTATVVGRSDDAVRVRTGDERSLTLGVSYPEDYRTGETVTVLEDGTWRGLAAEPYDAFDRQLSALAAGLPGGSLLLTGLLTRRRAAALRRTPVPVLRVLERMDDGGRIWIYAGDDTAGRTPVFAGRFTADRPGPDEFEEPYLDGEADGREPFTVDTRLREAVMFGSPYDGGELVLATTGRDAGPVVIRTTSPVRPPRPGRGPTLATGEVTDAATGEVTDAATGEVTDAATEELTDSGTGLPDPLSMTGTDRVPASLVATGQPLRWAPGAVARTGGAALALVIMAGVALVGRSLVTDGLGWRALLLPGMLAFGGAAAEQLNWRVVADSSGVWLADAWRVRHVSWERLRSIRRTDDGSVEMTTVDGGTWRLRGLGLPRAERRLGITPPYVRMVEEVTALRAHPELRPTEPVSPRDRGFPLGPGLLALTILVAVTWTFR
ncbi:hypothetical protein [Streptomyces hokutonensis]|uniref:hypothetical protein n=1 Tax=Streptomyces hokutonensis TaxID=1306990 RepID=UPI003679C06C